MWCSAAAAVGPLRAPALGGGAAALLRPTAAVWSGAAATAYSEAHTEWRAGVTDMQEGLAALEAAAKTAHQSYTDAASATLKILGV